MVDRCCAIKKKWFWYNWEKSILPCERTAEEVSYDWSHKRISSTDSKVRASLCSTINSHREKYDSGGFPDSITPYKTQIKVWNRGLKQFSPPLFCTKTQSRQQESFKQFCAFPYTKLNFRDWCQKDYQSK